MPQCPVCFARFSDSTLACPVHRVSLLPDVAAASLDRELAPGDGVGEYRIEDRLGAGGFGTVYRASHKVIGKAVAIKVLKRAYSAEPETLSRFIAEA